MLQHRKPRGRAPQTDATNPRLDGVAGGGVGWGWFSGYREYSYPHTTAVVVHGLLVAKSNGAEIPDRMLNSGIAWLMAYEKKQVAALQLHVEREATRKAGGKLKPTNRYVKARCDATDAFVEFG